MATPFQTGPDGKPLLVKREAVAGERVVGDIHNAIFVLSQGSGDAIILQIPYTNELDFQHKDTIQRLVASEKSDLEKLREVQHLVLEHDIPHEVRFPLNGNTMICSLKDLPRELPETLFQEPICGLTKFSTYANQFKPIDDDLRRPQYRILCDGVGFGEIDALKLTVPPEYKGCGYINDDNFVDVYLQVIADAVREAVGNNISLQGTGVTKERSFKGYRGGDELALVVFKDAFNDPEQVVRDILENVDNARTKLFKALKTEDLEKLDKAGHALRFRTVLGQLFDDLEAIRELPSETEPYTVKNIAGGLLTTIREGVRNGFLDLPDATLNAIIRSLREAKTEQETVEALGSLFYYAAQAKEKVSQQGSENLSLAMNHAILDLDYLESTEELAGHIGLGEDQIDLQKLTRKQTNTYIKHQHGLTCSDAQRPMIERLKQEDSELNAIREEREALGKQATPLEIAGLYDKLLERVCGDTGVPGTIRTSVARGMNFRELMRLSEPQTVYVSIRALQGMRVLNHLFGMNKADGLVGHMVRKYQGFSTPMLTLKHMGDTVYGIFSHQPFSLSLDESRNQVQATLDEELSKNDEGIIYAAYKYAGKMLVSRYLLNIKPSFQPTGQIVDRTFKDGRPDDRRILEIEIKPHHTLGHFLNEVQKRLSA